MKKRTDCDFAAIARSIGGLTGMPLLTSRVSDFGEAISAPHQGPQSGRALMKLSDGQLFYEGNLGSETRQLC
jgi:hypothetical protein